MCTTPLRYIRRSYDRRKSVIVALFHFSTASVTAGHVTSLQCPSARVRMRHRRTTDPRRAPALCHRDGLSRDYGITNIEYSVVFRGCPWHSQTHLRMVFWSINRRKIAWYKNSMPLSVHPPLPCYKFVCSFGYQSINKNQSKLEPRLHQSRLA